MKKDRLIRIKEEYNNVIEQNSKIKNNLSYIRLALFIIIIALGIWVGFKQGFVIALLVLAIIAFIAVSIIHRKYFKIVDDTNYKLTIVNGYLSRFDDSYKRNSDKGIDLKKDSFTEADLDLFGNQSLFAYLSFAKTPYGRSFLSEALRGNLISDSDLLKRQKAIFELGNDLDKSISIEAEALKFNSINDHKKISSLENAFNLLSNEVIFNPLKLIVNVIVILGLITTIILAVLNILNPYFPLIVIFCAFFISKVIYKDADSLGGSIKQINNIFYGYNYLLDSIQSTNFESELLNEYKKEVMKLNSKSIKSFKLISGLLSSRNNIIFQVIFNGTLMLDGILVYLYTIWQAKYENDFKNAIIAVGHIEELLSLATIEIVKENSTIPQISSAFEFEDIKHPLITEEKCIPNSFEFNNTNIITGSNMSGKTTFMRSIGVNYLLFLAGSSVCATSFKAPIARLFTSMKVVDDVNNNISTFYGEILRVKDICSYIKENKPMIVLVDEIFKGTNTKDRITGAKAFVEKLILANVKAIITTHDSELCSISGVNNFYFLEHYENDKIAFDYKIREGISTTRNAIYLLKMAGVIDK